MKKQQRVEGEPLKQKENIKVYISALLVVSWFPWESWKVWWRACPINWCSVHFLNLWYRCLPKLPEKFKQIKFGYEYVYDYCHYRAAIAGECGVKATVVIPLAISEALERVIQWIKHVNYWIFNDMPPKEALILDEAMKKWWFMLMRFVG